MKKESPLSEPPKDGLWLHQKSLRWLKAAARGIRAIVMGREPRLFFYRSAGGRFHTFFVRKCFKFV